MARWATFIKRHGDPDAAWLTVDVGNLVERAGSTGGCASKCKFAIASYRDLHYDVLNIGRQEAWLGRETLQAIADTLEGTELLSANLVDRRTRRPIVRPTIVKDFGFVRVGLIGLLNEADFGTGTLLDTTTLMVTPYMRAAKKYIPPLARRVDAVIVLAELSSAAIDTLIKTFPQIDLVISTGPLRSGETLATVGKARVLGTGSSGYSGHSVTLEFNPAWGDSIAMTTFQAELTEAYDEPGEWADRVNAFNAAPAVNVPSAPTQPKIQVTPTKAPMGGKAQPLEKK